MICESSDKIEKSTTKSDKIANSTSGSLLDKDKERELMDKLAMAHATCWFCGEWPSQCKWADVHARFLGERCTRYYGTVRYDVLHGQRDMGLAISIY